MGRVGTGAQTGGQIARRVAGGSARMDECGGW